MSIEHQNVTYTATQSKPLTSDGIDPITVQVVRNALNSAANQMKRALIRTAFSPTIYEVLDFAAAIYDSELRLLSQAPSLPLFMGTLNFCIEAAVEGVGGVDALEPGDIILYNNPFGTGSHPQDAALVMPAFTDEGVLVGYTAIKAHWLDIGAKEPYSTDTVDLFQEGTIFPGVKLYQRGELNQSVYRIALANSRVPKNVSGDIQAQAIGVRVGVEGLLRVVKRFGKVSFEACIEHMYDHGEKTVRSYLETIPDGTYLANGQIDNSGLDDIPIPFELTVTVAGSDVTVDYSNSPEEIHGPVNCPLPSTVSASRVAISMLAGNNEAPSEGHFRPVKVITKPGTMFHPLPPAPSFLYGWPAMQVVDVIYRALANAMPNSVPAGSGGDVCGLVWWGKREATDEPWATGSPHPVGQGACWNNDGGTLMHVSESATRFAPAEVWETQTPWIMEKVELAIDSCGAGQFRGGHGIDFSFHLLEDAYVTTVVERTKFAPWGLKKGYEGRPNSVAIRYPNGECTDKFGKKSRQFIPKGSTLDLHTGGGGGFGPTNKRDPKAIKNDIVEGYISEDYARKYYPHAFSKTTN